jgi:hypothetical protein
MGFARTDTVETADSKSMKEYNQGNNEILKHCLCVSYFTVTAVQSPCWLQSVSLGSKELVGFTASLFSRHSKI